MGERLHRQAPFLHSVLSEADHHRRRELLRLANADQINVISEFVLNTLRDNVPRSRHTIRLLRPHNDALRQMSKSRQPLNYRRALMMEQTGGDLWRELFRCYKRCR